MRTYLAVPFLLLSFLATVVFANDFIYDSEGRRDPFFVLVDPTGKIIDSEAKGSLSEIYLEGVIYDPGQGNSAAIVNGEMFKLHDFIGLYELTDIKTDSIVLTKDDQIFEIKLDKEEK